MPETEGQSDDLGRAIGLCADCAHLRTQTTRRGARYYRCARADHDARFLRYPPIPVTRCPGYAPSPERGSRGASGQGT